MPRGNTGHGAFARLRALPNFEIIHERVVCRWPSTVIAKSIQDAGFYTDVKTASLVKQIKRYRASQPMLRGAHKVSVREAEKILNTEKQIRALTEAVQLYRKQRERLATAVALERKLGKLIPSVCEDMRVAGEMLQRIHTIKMQLGIAA